MAEEKSAAAPAPAGPAGPSKLPMMMAVANTVAVLAAMGALLYTRVLFHRPAITEHGERQRLNAPEVAGQPGHHREAEPGTVAFERFTATIKPTPAEPQESAAGLQGKIHYLTIAFTLEIRDSGKADKIEAVKPVFKDRLLTALGQRDFAEINTVQGRYLLRSEIIELVNSLAGEPVATNVFFTEFIVQ